MKKVERYSVYWVNLDPTVGTEMKKIRPGVIVSPDELNSRLNHVTIVPVTSHIQNFPFHSNVVIKKQEGQCACEHIRTVDKKRLGRKIGALSKKEAKELSDILQIMFAY